MSKYKCGMRGDPKVFAHDHDTNADWKSCSYPEYRGMNSPLEDRELPSEKRRRSTTSVKEKDEGKLYLGAPSQYDVDKLAADKDEIVSDRKALASAETDEQRAERKAAEEKAREAERNAEREQYVRQLKSKKAPLQVEVEGLKADQRTGRHGWVFIGLGGAASLALLGAAAVLGIFGTLFTALVVMGFVVGGVGALADAAFALYWFERFYGGSNAASEIKKREVQIGQIDTELSHYSDIMPDALVM